MAALAYYFTLGVVLYFTHGMYEERLIFVLLAAHVAYAVHLFSPDAFRIPRSGVAYALGAGMVASGVALAHSDGLFYAIGPARETLDRGLEHQAEALLLLVAAWPWIRYRAGRIAYWALGGALVLMAIFVVERGVLLASPSPHIDVWTSSQKAVGFLLAGKNPYSQRYDDIYGGQYDYRPGMTYFPGWPVWSTLGALVLPGGHDVRASLVAADVLACVFLVGAMRCERVQPELWLLVVLAWLTFPIGPFVLEQSWIDRLLIACFAAAAWAFSAKRPMLAGVAMGYACAAKQYAPLGAALAFVHAWRAFGFRGALRYAAAAAAVVSLVVLPFVLIAPKDFYAFTIDAYVTQLPRPDALAVPTYYVHHAMPIDMDHIKKMYTPYSVLTLALVALVFAWMARRRTPATTASWLGATAVAYGFFWIFAKLSFCNYYFLDAFFALASAACGMGARDLDPPEVSAG
jgi:hypothetical protein